MEFRNEDMPCDNLLLASIRMSRIWSLNSVDTVANSSTSFRMVKWRVGNEPLSAVNFKEIGRQAQG